MLLLATALLPKTGPERVEAGEPTLHAAPKQPGESRLRSGAREQVVRHLLEDVARDEVRPERVLGPVPPRVLDAHPYSLRGGGRSVRGRQPIPSPVNSARSTSPKQMNPPQANATH